MPRRRPPRAARRRCATVATPAIGDLDRTGSAGSGSTARSRRSTAGPAPATVFLTLRDPAPTSSLTVTCHRRRARRRCRRHSPRAPGSSCTPSPSSTSARGTLSLRADEIRPVGLGELLARLEQLKTLLAAEGLFAADRKRPLPFLPPRGRADHRPRLGRRARRARERPPPLAGRRVPGRATSPSRDRRRPAGDRGADGARPRPQPSTSSSSPAAAASVEDLLPFSDEALVPRGVRAAARRWSARSATSTDTPLLDLVADVRASTPTDAAKRIVPDLAEELRPDRAGPRAGHEAALRHLLDREQRGLTARPLPPGPRRPRTIRDRAAARRIETRCAPYGARRSPTGSSRAADELVHLLGPRARAVAGSDARPRVRGGAARRTATSSASPADGGSRAGPAGSRRGWRFRRATATDRVSRTVDLG